MFDLSRLPHVLSGPNITLESYTTADSEALFAVLSDPRVWEHIPQDVPTNPAELDDSLRRRIRGLSRATFTIRSSSAIVGTTSVLHDPESPTGAEIGATYLQPAVWGTGVNTESKRLLIDELFQQGAEWVDLRTDERNLRSAAAIAKLGAIDLGTRDDSFIRRDGTQRRSRFFRLKRPDGT